MTTKASIDSLLDTLVQDIREDIDSWTGGGCADYSPDDTWQMICEKFEKIGGKVPRKFSNKNLWVGFNQRLTVTLPVHNLKIHFFFNMEYHDYHDDPYYLLEDARIEYEYSEKDLANLERWLKNVTILDRLVA